MKFDDLLSRVNKLPVFETEMLLSGVSESGAIKVQISRWEKAGKLVQLKRGIYLLSEAYRKVEIFEPYLAAILKKPSYISLQKALEYHGLIPEAVMNYTSVTTKRPGKFVSDIGVFDYRHMQRRLFWGYTSVTVRRQTAFMAEPEKALLDFFYLNGLSRVDPAYIEGMRLQNLDKIHPEKLLKYAAKFQSPGVTRAADLVVQYMEENARGEKTL